MTMMIKQLGKIIASNMPPSETILAQMTTTRDTETAKVCKFHYFLINYRE